MLAAAFAARTCPAAAQVGTSSIAAVSTASGLSIPITASGKIFVLQPNPGETARLGIDLFPDGVAATLSPHAILSQSVVSVRDTTDSGLDSTLTGLPKTADTVVGPADVVLNSLDLTLSGAAANGPFESNPTSCGTNTTSVDVVSYEDPGTVASGSGSFATTGCDQVPFTPSVSVTPETTRANAPSGYTVNVSVPGTDNGAGIRQAHVRDTAVTLPLGVGLNPALAAGLDACTDAQFGLGTHVAPTCPASAQIGTVTLDTPVVGAIHGIVYFAAPNAQSLLRLFVVVNGPGFLVKLAGTNDVDPATGQITAHFSSLPQIPFTNFTLSFNGGDHAVLINSSTCGPATTTATLTPYNGAAPVSVTSAFTVDADGAGTPCPASPPFAPTIASDVDPTQAGSPTTNTITLARSDSDQLLHDVTVSLPPGLAGSLAGVPFCADAQANAGTCGAESRVGTVTAQAGVGSAPLTITGPVYLAGPGDGALARLAIVLPGKVGPFDFGNLVSFAKLLIRTSDGGLDVVTDNLPTTLAGIPLHLRQIKLALDRPGFALNATSCDPHAIHASFVSTTGTTATADAPYQATGCDKLAYNPTVSAVISGATRVGGRPKIAASVLEGPGQAASKRVTLTLPLTIPPDLELINKIQCTLDQQAANACPKTSIVGSATAKTPLLPIPLTGDVYILQTPSGYPSLRLTLAPLGLTVVGTTTLVGQQLTTTFDNLPDTPLSSFELDFNGGKGGITLLGADVCQGAAQIANGEFLGQNGKSKSVKSVVHIVGCKPSASASVTGRGRGTRLTLTAHAARHGARLRSVKFTLPSRLMVAKWRSSQRSFTPKAGTKARRVSSHVVSVTLPRTGATTVSVVVKGGAVHTLSRGSRTATVHMTDATGKTVTLHVTVHLPRAGKTRHH